MEEANIADEDALRASWSRRRFLRGSAAGAVGVAAATIAACAPAPPGAWLYRSPTPGASGVPIGTGTPIPTRTPLPTGTPGATPTIAEGQKGMCGMVNALIVQA